MKGAKDCLKERLPLRPGLLERAKDCLWSEGLVKGGKDFEAAMY